MEKVENIEVKTEMKKSGETRKRLKGYILDEKNFD